MSATNNSHYNELNQGYKVRSDINPWTKATYKCVQMKWATKYFHALIFTWGDWISIITLTNLAWRDVQNMCTLQYFLLSQITHDQNQIKSNWICLMRIYIYALYAEDLIIRMSSHRAPILFYYSQVFLKLATQSSQKRKFVLNIACLRECLLQCFLLTHFYFCLIFRKNIVKLVLSCSLFCISVLESN